MEFREAVVEGIPDYLPELQEYDKSISHAPKRKDILTKAQKKLALRNALRYFDKKFHPVFAKEFAQRAAINQPLQGTAADLIKMAMIKIDEELTKKNLKSKMVMQVHDELVFEAAKDEIEELKSIVKNGMEMGQPFKVPLEVDINCGASWKE